MVSASDSGVTATTAYLLDMLHTASGLPWWATVATGVLAVRLSVIPLQLRAMAANGRMRRVAPFLALYRAQAQAAAARGDHAALKLAADEGRVLQQRNGVSLAYMFAPLLIQLPVGIILFMTLRRMANDAATIPGFTSEGAPLWPDLSAMDPTFSLPITTGALTMMTFELSQRINPNASAGFMGFSQQQVAWGMRGITLFFLAMTANQPAVSHPQG